MQLEALLPKLAPRAQQEALRVLAQHREHTERPVSVAIRGHDLSAAQIADELDPTHWTHVGRPDRSILVALLSDHIHHLMQGRQA